MMTREEFEQIRQFIEKKALALMKHERKNGAKVGLSIDKFRKYIIRGRVFYSISTNVFKVLIEEYIERAQEKFPEKFGTGNAIDVIEAIYNIEPTFTLEGFINFLIDEQFAYVIEIKNGEVLNKILRIDLFRKLNETQDGKKEFTGGIFHCFKHFSINNLNLSTGKDVHNIEYPEQLLHLVTEAFFISNLTHETSRKAISFVNLDTNYKLKFVYYFEKKSKVYFIKTIHKVAK